MIREILRESWRLVLKNWFYIFLLWGTNIILSLVLTIPILSMLRDNLSHSLWSSKLAIQVDYFWLLQFQNSDHNMFNKLPILFFSIVGINLLIQKLYQGGLIAVLSNPKKNHISDFFYSGVKFWYRFIKVTLLAILILAIILLIDSKLDSGIEYLTKAFNSVLLDLIFRSIRYLILLFLIGAISIISEYTQIFLALKDSQKIGLAFKNIFQLMRKRFWIVFSTYLIVSIIGALGAIVYNIVAIYIPRSPFYFLILTFILQQMLIIFRLSITMLLYATEVYLFKDYDAEVITE
ncbi:MAG: hypothetical protein KKF62_03160 [Bacteroidetes bacterium]|nr:hypothetical protein [Bacteroidota bacterium]MBU1115048.1 hypothetical protein [Bacteroidota bacterium]MBU1799540.1 hypothetical protein [Bacteroidota bacterium]